MEEILTKLRASGYDLPTLELDGAFHEFSTASKKGWYVGHLRDGKAVVTLGDWRTGQKLTQKHGYALDDKSWSEVDKENEKVISEARTAKQKAVALALEKRYKDLETIPSSIYLNKKGLHTLPEGVKCVVNQANTEELFIPMTDLSGKIWNLHVISPLGAKSFEPEARKKDLIHVINSEKITQASEIILCEGYSTGVSLKLARPKAQVVCAFGSTNMENVALALRKKYKHSKIVVACDNDFTKTPNAGLEAGEQAALRAHATLCVPEQLTGCSDFNDIMQAKGLEAVTQALELSFSEVLATAEVITDGAHPKYLEGYINGVQPLAQRLAENGKPLPPTDLEVAHHILMYYKDKVLKYEGELFFYEGKRWVSLGEDNLAKVRVQINVALGKQNSQRKAESILRTFKDIVPHMYKNPYITSPYVCVVGNKTLRVMNDKIEEHAHDTKDLNLNYIDIDYDPRATCPEFLSFLNRLFEGDSDQTSKIESVQEMYGACLFPIYPKLFMIFGRAATGKSTLIYPAHQMIAPENCASLDPHLFEGFHMESLIGKMVNIVTDIELDKPIPNHTIKTIEDRVPISINRKGRALVRATIPAVHIFGGNNTPATYEKSDAHRRRWILLKIQAKPIENDKMDKNYGIDLFLKEKEGILAWALEGARRVVANRGKYTVPESSLQEMDSWLMEHDSIGQWLAEIKEGGSKYLENKDVEKRDEYAERSKVWEVFKIWYEDSYGRSYKPGKHRFFKRLDETWAQTFKDWKGIYRISNMVLKADDF
jgi:P4 family phage/plasmid primase-like protien